MLVNDFSNSHVEGWENGEIRKWRKDNEGKIVMLVQRQKDWFGICKNKWNKCTPLSLHKSHAFSLSPTQLLSIFYILTLSFTRDKKKIFSFLKLFPKLFPSTEKQCKTTLNFPFTHCQTQTTHPQQKWESPQTIISNMKNIIQIHGWSS